MPQCCRCNGNGRCKACICVRSGKPCTDCTPSHVGRFENRGGAAGAGGAKPDDWDPIRAIIIDDTPALVNGPMKSHGQSTERERLEPNNDGKIHEMPLPDNRTHGMESEIDVVLLHDNQTSSMASVMSQSTDNYEDPWPLPTCSQPNFQ